jgi:hypothetical protein
VYVGIGGNRLFNYDAENRQVNAFINNLSSTPIVSYMYDGHGLRVSKTVNGATTTNYVYDALGNLAAEDSACGTGTCSVTWDHLGSTRTHGQQSQCREALKLSSVRAGNPGGRGRSSGGDRIFI